MNSSPTTPSATSASARTNVPRAEDRDETPVVETPGKHALARTRSRTSIELVGRTIRRLRRLPVRLSAHSPASVGVIVNETKSEVSVEITTTIANSRDLPADLPADERDRKEDDDVDERDDDGRCADLLAPSIAASSGGCLSSVKCRSMFSSTTVESSTRMPITSDIPSSEIVSSVRP